MLSTSLLVLACSFPAFLASPAPGAEDDPPTGLLLETQLLATLPEGMTLDFPVERIYGQEYQRPHCLGWSPNGRRVAYIGTLEGKEHIVIGDEVLEHYDFTQGPYFSADSSRVLFRVGNRISKSKERWWILLDGDEIYKEDWIGTPALSDDGQEIAFWSQPGARIVQDGAYNNEGQVFVLLEGKGSRWKERESGRSSNAISLEQPVFVGDQAFTAGGFGEPWEPVSIFSLERGKKKPEIEAELERLPSWFAVDPAGKHWGVTVPVYRQEQGALVQYTQIVMDGKPLQREDAVEGPYFSPLDKRFALKVTDGERFGIELDGREVEPAFEFVRPPVFGAGNRIAFVAGANLDPVSPDAPIAWREPKGGERFVVRRHKRGPDEPADLRWLDVGPIAFSPDGDRLAYAARSEAGWQVVVDGVPGPLLDEVGPPRFSEDSETVVHGARVGAELWWRVWAPADDGAEAVSGDAASE